MQEESSASFDWELEPMVLEYWQLSALPKLSEAQTQRLGQILAYAIDNPELDFRISEVDYRLGQSLGFLDEKSRKSYGDQQALLREYLGHSISCSPCPIDGSVTNSVDLGYPMSQEEMQTENLSYC